MNDPLPALRPESLLPHADLVRRLARGLARDENEAAELVQLTLLAAHRRGDHPEAASQGWLAAVMRNFARLTRRQESRRDRRERAAARPEALPSTADVVERIELHQHLVQSVLALEEPYRSVLLLRFFEDMTHAEVAGRLGVPVETVRTRQKKALALLRRRLRPGAALLGGILWMTAKTKAALAALLVVGASVVWWQWDGGAVANGPARESEGQATLAPIQDEDPPDALEVVRAAEVDSPRATPTDPVVETPAPTVPGILSDVEGQVVDVSGRPLADVEVLLFHSPPSRRGERLLASHTTIADGRFSFPDTFFAGRQPGGVLVCTKQGLGLGGANVDPHLDLPHVITLQLPTTLEGRVTDTVGRPIASASVSLELFWSDAWQLPLPEPFHQRVRTRTDREGRFQLSGLPMRERAMVKVRHDEYASNYRMVPLDDAAISGPADFVLWPSSTIEGHVTDGVTGAGVAGVRVVAQGCNSHEDWTNNWHEAVTDEEGFYALTGVLEGTWNVMPDFDSEQASQWTAASLDSLVVALGETVEDADLVLSAGALLNIRCVDARSGQGVEGANVALYSAYRPRSGAAVQSVLTDVAGLAEVRVPPGEVYVYVMVEPDGYLSTGLAGTEFTAEDGETRDLVFELYPAQSVTGIVVDPAGLPVAGATVKRYGGFSRRSLMDQGVRTDRAGHFEIGGFAPGQARSLIAEAEGLGMPEPFQVEDGEAEVRLELQRKPEVVVRGHVVDDDGAAVEDAVVELVRDTLVVLPSMNLNPHRTASDGSFEIREAWPGRYKVRVMWLEPGSDEYQTTESAVIELEEGVVEVGEIVLRSSPRRP